MAEKIMTFYSGEDKYSDGDIESEILEYVKNTPESELEKIFSKDDRWPVYYHLSPIRQNIINWYDIKPDSSVLEIGAGMGAITGILCQKAKRVTAVELSDRRAQTIYERHKHYDNLKIIVGNLNDITFEEKFDYITLIGVLEYAKMFTEGKNPYQTFINNIKKLLKPDGKLIIAIENKYGLKYFCGASEDHTGKAFDGINGYNDNSNVMTFDKNSLEKMLVNSGLKNFRFYYPEPDYKLPNYIFTDKSFPSNNITSKIHHYYQPGSFLIADEKKILDDVISNQVYSFFANSFLVEASETAIDEKQNPNLVVFNNERKPEYRLITAVYDDVVYKIPQNKKAIPHLYTIMENTKELKARGIKVIENTLEDDRISLPFVKEKTFDKVIIDLILEDKIDEAKKLVSEFNKEILKSSDKTSHNILIENKIVDENCKLDFGPILKKGYVDMTFFNCFYINGEFVFMDQEWVQYDVPAEYVIFRSFYCIWHQCKEISEKFNEKDFIKVFNINTDILDIGRQLNEMLYNDIFAYFNASPFFSYLSSTGKFKQNYDDVAYQARENLEKQNLELNQARENLEKQNLELNQARENLEKQNIELNRIKCSIEQQMYEFKTLYNETINSACWKFMSPVRVVFNVIKRILKSNRITLLLYKFLVSLKNIGLKHTLAKVKNKFQYKNKISSNQYIASEEELTKQKHTKFDKNIKFSILTPLYNTPETFLREMIESVINQTYENWELCLVDASDNNHKYVSKIVCEYSKKDKRIKYKKLAKNLGISENTNECIKMATGDYIGLLDHDDILAPSALFENMNAISITNADVLYSDEDKITEQGKHHLPFFKPDWSRDLLHAQMYICHFLVIKYECIQKLNGFNNKYDGSQDYDLMLRLSEHTDKICHIPRVLYSWRETDSSTSLNPDAKSYAQIAGLNAIDSYLKRRYGKYARAEETEFLYVYKARFENHCKDLVSIIVPIKDNLELTKKCIKSIVEKTTYKNYEIIILNNRSEKLETIEWLNKINESDNITVVDADFSFNWSKLNNLGIQHAKGSIFVFLNNDVEVIENAWLDYIVENCLRDDIGVVGALLLYSDNTIQHAGVVVGMGGFADHIFKGMPLIRKGDIYVSPLLPRNVLAVTGACMAVSKKVIDKIGLFNEEFIICGSDVEFCLRAYEKGFNNLYLPYVKLYHLESKTRSKLIPDIDYSLSEYFYKHYKINGDPYFNCNLSYDNLVPMQGEKIMNKEKYINYIERLKVLRNNFKKKSFSNFPKIPEINPLTPKKNDLLSDVIRLNLVIPSINKEHIFGGISTALNIYHKLKEKNNVKGRIIVIDSIIRKESVNSMTKYKLIDISSDSIEDCQIIDATLRDNKNLSVGKNDIFIVTSWWSAYIVLPILEWQKSTYNCDIHNMIYLIQDYEPGFYPWSSKYILAESTYRSFLPVTAVFNSLQLKDFFVQKGYCFSDVYFFEPCMNKELSIYLKQLPQIINKEKIILLYGRPETPRNAFELIISALMIWSVSFDCSYEWKVISLGEKHNDIVLENNVIIDSRGKVSLSEYASLMSKAYIGISLMVSPHPSYPPLEMASFGIKVITNNYENKRMDLYDNIIALDNCTPNSLCNILTELCNGYSQKIRININEKYVNNDNVDNICNKIILK